MGEPELVIHLPVQQVARSLGCTHQHVYSLIREGALVTINVGTAERPSYRISEKSLSDFIADRTVTAA